MRRVRSNVNGVKTMQWPRYLDAFHTQHPGITEDVLGHARTGDGDAYDWLADAVGVQSTVLDLGCGTAPLWSRLPGRTYLGLDLNAAELAAARHSGALHLIRATATAIPVRTDSIDTIVCSMALQILTPLPCADRDQPSAARRRQVGRHCPGARSAARHRPPGAGRASHHTGTRADLPE